MVEAFGVLGGVALPCVPCEDPSAGLGTNNGRRQQVVLSTSHALPGRKGLHQSQVTDRQSMLTRVPNP